MKRSILKFGGTSVSTIDKIQNIAKYLKTRIENDEQLIVVVSAMGKTTDDLVSTSKLITSKPQEIDLALLLSSGEQQTVAYLSMALNSIDVSTKALTGYQAGIVTVGRHIKSRISSIDSELFKKLFHQYEVIVVAGFQGCNELGELTTLGRGGSDTTAVALASALGYPCEIYSDVSGIFTTDPSIYPKAKLREYISYEDMIEMSALGAGVLETRSVEIANNYKIPLYIGKTLSTQKGTWVISSDNILEKKDITGVALDTNILYMLIKYPSYDNYLFHDILVHFEREDISVDMITEIHGEEGLQFAFVAKETERHHIQQSLAALEETYPGLEATLADHYSKVSVIGSGMRDVTRVLSKVLRTLIKAQIPFYQVSTSELSISFIVEKVDKKRATQLLCEKLGL